MSCSLDDMVPPSLRLYPKRRSLQSGRSALRQTLPTWIPRYYLKVAQKCELCSRRIERNETRVGTFGTFKDGALARFDVTSDSQLDYESIVTEAGLRRPTTCAHAGRTTAFLKLSQASTRLEVNSAASLTKEINGSNSAPESRIQFRPIRFRARGADKCNDPRALSNLSGRTRWTVE